MKRSRAQAGLKSRTTSGKTKVRRIAPTRIQGPLPSQNIARARAAVGMEKKHVDLGVGVTVLASAGTVEPAAGSYVLIAQGLTDKTRVGNKITVTNFNLRFTLSQDDTGTGAIFNINFRYMLIIDKQCNGATLPTTLLLDPGNPALTTVDLKSFRNLDNTDRFEVLTDKFIHMSQSCTNALHSNQGESRVYKVSHKLNLPIHYSGTTGAITELKSNNLVALLIPDTTSTTTTNYTALARIKFVDA